MPSSPLARLAAEHLRRAGRRADGDPVFFCRFFLREKFPAPFAPFQVAMLDQVRDLAGQTRDVVEVPREHGKSTIRSVATPLYAVCLRRKRYVVIVSDSLPQAREHLQSVKDELNDNLWLRIAFGDLGERTARTWGADMIVLADGTVVRAMGKGQSCRGLLRGGKRPDLAILDDPQRLAHVQQHAQREKDFRWLMGELVPALDKKRGDFLLNATRLHRYCLSARLADMAAKVVRLKEGGTRKANRWTAVRYEAVQDGAPLWPGRYSLDELHAIRDDVGSSAWAREFRNAPQDDEGATAFKPDWIVWQDPPHSDELVRAQFLDPAAGKESGDYTAVVEVVHDRNAGVWWATRASVVRCSPRQGVETMARFAKSSNGWPWPKASGIEEDSLGQLMQMAREVESVNQVKLNLRGVRHTGNKMDRIVGTLQPLAESARLRFSPSLRGTLLMEQLLDIPGGQHDDGPDALEGAVRLTAATKPRIRRL